MPKVGAKPIPSKKVIFLGIGDTTDPFTPKVISISLDQATISIWMEV
jgi:hypothetical protein